MAVVQLPLPGAFVPSHAVTAAATAICAHVLSPCRACVHQAATALAAGLTAIDPSFSVGQHVLVIGDDRWTLQHPLSCRPNLHDCPVHADVDALDQDGLLCQDLGTHTVTVENGRVLIDGQDPNGDDDPSSDG